MAALINIISRYFKLVEQISFHDLRLHFLHSNHLQPSFSFARYLRKCKSHVMLQFGDIHTSCWMAMLVILLVDMIQRNSIVPLFTCMAHHIVAYAGISI